MSKQEIAIQMMQEGKFEESARLFTEAIAENPNDPVGYINIGNLLTQTQNYERALLFYQQALSLDPKAGAAFYGLGKIDFALENYQEARKSFQKSLDCGLEDGDVYYALGMTFYKENYSRLALPHLMRAMELLPGDAQVILQYGLALAQNQYILEAKEMFEHLLELQHDNSDAHYNLGVIAMYYDAFETAYDYFVAALQNQPDHALAANGKHQALAHLGRINEEP